MNREDLKDYAQKVAEELVSVQPMDTPKVKAALEYFFSPDRKSGDELLSEGYVPVDPQTRLMWIKKVSQE